MVVSILCVCVLLCVYVCVHACMYVYVCSYVCVFQLSSTYFCVGQAMSSKNGKTAKTTVDIVWYRPDTNHANLFWILQSKRSACYVAFAQEIGKQLCLNIETWCVGTWNMIDFVVMRVR